MKKNGFKKITRKTKNSFTVFFNRVTQFKIFFGGSAQSIFKKLLSSLIKLKRLNIVPKYF